MIKKLFLLCLSQITCIIASAYDFSSNNIDGITIYYNFNQDGTTVEVTKGDETYTNIVEIPETVSYENKTYAVTSIGDNAFYSCQNLTSVILPNSIKFIGNYAFCHSDLTTIDIPNSVITLGTRAFSDCSELTTINISNSVTFIGAYAFEDCSSLSSVTIPNSVTTIHYYTFSGCTGLTEATIPNSVTSIGEKAFYRCSSLASLSLSNSVTSIGEQAFYGCSSLASIKFPNSVTSIGEQAFYSCSSLASIKLPNSVISIGEKAFCFTAYYNDESNWENGILYVDNHIIDAKYSITGSHVIKDGTLTIADQAFYFCTKFTAITIPNSVTLIGKKAFCGCTSLSSVTIPNSITSISEGTFSSCSNLSSVTIPNSVTSICDEAFDGCESLASVTFPNSITSIGTRAFNWCTGLTEITIPSSVTSIDRNAFYSCKNLASITLPNSKVAIGADAFRSSAFFNNSSNWENDVLYIGNHLIEAESSLNGSYSIKNGTINIADEAFEDCKNLTSVSLPLSIISIGNRAFQGCSNLTSVNIPRFVTSLGEEVFENCYSLSSITIPNSISSIGYYAFDDCRSLISIEIPESVTEIGSHAFNGCSNLVSITLPENTLKSIGYKAFSGTAFINNDSNWDNDAFYIGKYLISVKTDIIGNYKIKENTLLIANNAFEHCSDLTSVTIPKSLISIGENAFHDVSLCNINLEGVVPPTGTKSVFDDLVYYKCMLNVPSGYIDSYKAVIPWCYFYNLQEGENSGIEGLDTTKYIKDNDSNIYNINGMLLKHQATDDDINALKPDLYIIGNKKVFVK